MIEFTPPSSAEARGFFTQVGLPHRTDVEWQGAQRRLGELVSEGWLFTMRPSANDSHSPIHFHHPYTREALSKVSSASGFRSPDGWAEWMKETGGQLQDFAHSVDARTLISKAVVAYYTGIAAHAVRVRRLGAGVLVPTFNTPGEAHPFASFSTNLQDMRLDHNQRLTDPDNPKGTYFPLQRITERIGWTIPGIASEPTQAAILKEFEAARKKTYIADPQSLFMSSQVKLYGTAMPVATVF